MDLRLPLDADVYVVEGAAAALVGQALAGQHVEAAPSLAVGAPPDAFADERAGADAAAQGEREAGRAALVAAYDGIAVRKPELFCIVGVHQKFHDLAAREFLTLVEGGVEDACIGSADELERLVVAVGGEVVGQGRLFLRVQKFDLARGRFEVELVILGQRKVDGQPCGERCLVHGKRPGVGRGDQLVDEFILAFFEERVVKP